MQQAVFLVVFKHFLETEELAPVPIIEKSLGGKLEMPLSTLNYWSIYLVKVDLDNSLNEFHIQLEDVLHAYISLVNESVRSVKRVFVTIVS